MDFLKQWHLFEPVVVLPLLAVVVSLPFVIVVQVRHFLWKRRERERMRREMEERGLPDCKLRRAEKPQGKLKHIEANTMPLGLRKLVRTGSPHDKGVMG